MDRGNITGYKINQHNMACSEYKNSMPPRSSTLSSFLLKSSQSQETLVKARRENLDASLKRRERFASKATMSMSANSDWKTASALVLSSSTEINFVLFHYRCLPMMCPWFTSPIVCPHYVLVCMSSMCQVLNRNAKAVYMMCVCTFL